MGTIQNIGVKKALIVVSILLFALPCGAVTNWYNATSTIGGGTGALDSINGILLQDGDKAIVVTTSGQTYIYALDSDSALSEDSTNYSVVSPDTNAGDKRWILQWKGGRVLIPDSTIDQGDSSVVGTLAWHISDANGNNTTVSVLEGTYTISTVISLAGPIKLTGNGTLYLANSIDDDMFEVSGTDVIIEGITFDGNGANQSRSTAVNIIHATTQIKRLTVRGCTFKNAGSSAILLNTGLAHEDIIITDNKFIDYYQTAVSPWGALRVNVSNNIFDNTGVTPDGNGNAISFAQGNYNVTCANNNIKMGDSQAETFGITAGNSATSYHIAITGNTIDAGDYSNNGGISVADAINVSVVGNNITKTQNIAGIESADSSAVSIEGNTIYDVDCAAIAINGDNHTISISGNAIDAFSSQGISLQLSGGTFANFYGIAIRGNSLTNSTGASGSGEHVIYANGVPGTGLTITGNTIYNASGTRAIVLISQSGETHNGFVITGNSIYNVERWIEFSGDGTHQNHVVVGNSVVSDSVIPYLDGTGHIFSNNGPSAEELTGTVTISVWKDAGYINSNGGKVEASLGDGVYIGQRKTIVMTDASVSSELWISHHDLGDSKMYTFDAVDEVWIGEWTGTEWITIYATAT